MNTASIKQRSLQAIISVTASLFMVAVVTSYGAKPTPSPKASPTPTATAAPATPTPAPNPTATPTASPTSSAPNPTPTATVKVTGNKCPLPEDYLITAADRSTVTPEKGLKAICHNGKVMCLPPKAYQAHFDHGDKPSTPCTKVGYTGVTCTDPTGPGHSTP